MYRLIGSLKTRAFRVAWMLEELGLSYDLDPAAPRSPEVRALNASGKVPVLETEEGVITDSVAIMTYLCDRHGAFSHPAGNIARGRQDAVTMMLCDDLDAVLWAAARHSFVLPEEHRVPEVKPSLKWEFARNMARIGAQFEGQDYVLGDAPCLPDFLLAHCTNWADAATFEFDAPWVRAHRDRMVARPAYRKATKLRG